ncbi:chaperonin 10-like protein [Lophiotrema nucula]|uniref:Chaperonin 10-like protein n=1 Tax=Lophiotrema nucula TaxID=690887 RepID=A0A6A5ZD97_9PLEO|nr:chaperonin 10-like protein [Lophiotrema nucula]
MPKQVIVHSSIESVEIIDTPIPTPKDHEIVIKVIVSGTNPKDWKYPLWKGWSHNSGDDIAGIVHSVGKDVYEFKPGDRVAAAHEFGTENGSFAEYSVALDWVTFHIPHNVSFEEAATIPSAAFTAALALYSDMDVSPPYLSKEQEGSGEKTPIILYGVTTAVGAFAAKLARLSGLHPIIGVAGRAASFARDLSDYVVDYRAGEDSIVSAIEDILAKEGLDRKVRYGFDCVNEQGSLETTLRLIDTNGGQICTVLPPSLFSRTKENFKWPEGVKGTNTACPQVQTTLKDFGYIWARLFSRLLADGRLTAHPYEVIPGGLNGILIGLQKLRNGEASALKYVYRIEETGKVAAPKISEANAATKSSQDTKPVKDFPFPVKDEVSSSS